MWEDDWARLGIEPTSDLVAIKKAYSAKLKVTRPDDDAEAYQALRGAYERTQQWVKWKLQSLADVDEAAPTSLAKPVPTPPPPPTQVQVQVQGQAQVQVQVQETVHSGAPLDVAATGLLGGPTPDELVLKAEQQRLRGGSAGLIQTLPTLLLELDRLPVGTEAAASQAFAFWVLQHADVPLDVLSALDEHFGWRRDYRAERVLGAELASQLQAALDERMPAPISDPAIISQASPLLGFETLRLRPGGGVLALLIGALCLPSLKALRNAFGDRLLRGLGLSRQEQTWLDNTLMLCSGLRWLLPIALLAGTGWLIASDWEDGLKVSCGALAALVGFRMLCQAAGRLLCWDTDAGQQVRFTSLLRWRARHASGWLGVGIVAAGATAAEIASNWMAGWWLQALGILAVAVGSVAMHWSRSPDRAHALAGCVLASMLALRSALGSGLLASTWLALGVLWAWLGVAVYERRHAALSDSPVAWIVRPVSNTLALADRWGWAFAIWPTMLLSAVAAATHISGLLFAWGAWSLAAFVLYSGQSAVDRACHRWLARQAGVVL